MHRVLRPLSVMSASHSRVHDIPALETTSSPTSPFAPLLFVLILLELMLTKRRLYRHGASPPSTLRLRFYSSALAPFLLVFPPLHLSILFHVPRLRRHSSNLVNTQHTRDRLAQPHASFSTPSDVPNPSTVARKTSRCLNTYPIKPAHTPWGWTASHIAYSQLTMPH